MTIRHLVFPFDFSSQGFLAAPFVRAFAERCGARITLLAVIAPAWDASEVRRIEADFRSRLDAALTTEFDGLPVERRIVFGDPGLKIAEFADTNAADLIMMPTHGLGVFRSLLIGSVTAKVLHDAKTPVWTAAHAEEQHSRNLPATVLCAIDGTSGAGELLQWAAGFTQSIGAGLKLLHVVPPISDWLSLPGEREIQEKLREAARSELGDVQQTAAIESPLRIAVGRIPEAIAEEARRENADLIVIGRGAAHSSLGRLRTHTYGVIQKSPCPVISV
ncbi:MAG TPA: universal stress protein [Bryobacteraceae bacterium]